MREKTHQMVLKHLVVSGSKERLAGEGGGGRTHNNMVISKHSRNHQKEFPVAKAII